MLPKKPLGWLSWVIWGSKLEVVPWAHRSAPLSSCLSRHRRHAPPCPAVLNPARVMSALWIRQRRLYYIRFRLKTYWFWVGDRFVDSKIWIFLMGESLVHFRTTRPLVLTSKIICRSKPGHTVGGSNAGRFGARRDEQIGAGWGRAGQGGAEQFGQGTTFHFDPQNDEDGCP